MPDWKRFPLGVQTMLGLLVVTMLGGCATSSDLDKISSSLHQRLELVSNGLRSETGRLQSQLDAMGKRQQEVVRAIEGLKALVEGELRTTRNESKAVLDELRAREATSGQMLKDLRGEAVQTRKVVEESATRSQQDLRKLDAVAEQASKQLHGLQQIVAGFGHRLDEMPSLVGAIGQEVHGLNQTLVNGYRLEESALRERLKTVEHVLKRLKPPPSDGVSEASAKPGGHGEARGGTGQTEPRKPPVRIEASPPSP